MRYYAIFFFLPMQCYALLCRNYSADNFRGRNFAITTNMDALVAIIGLRARRTNSHFRYRPLVARICARE